MQLSWIEISSRALKFSKKWKDAKDEAAEAQSFLNDFFEIFGVDRKRIGTFETKVPMGKTRNGYIDLLWKGVILIEMKSFGKSLDKAYSQARDYAFHLEEEELPVNTLLLFLLAYALFFLFAVCAYFFGSMLSEQPLELKEAICIALLLALLASVFVIFPQALSFHAHRSNLGLSAYGVAMCAILFLMVKRYDCDVFPSILMTVAGILPPSMILYSLRGVLM